MARSRAYAARPEAKKAASDRRKEKKQEIRAYQSTWEKGKYKENPSYFLDRHLRKKFGISIADFLAMSEAQGNVCASCGRPPRALTEGQMRPPRLVVDHDHATGAVRGLLCHQCNLALGFAKDKIEILEGLISYLKRGE